MDYRTKRIIARLFEDEAGGRLKDLIRLQVYLYFPTQHPPSPLAPAWN